VIKQLKKITHLLLNPFVLAILPALVIIWLFPWKRDRYLLEEVSRVIVPEHAVSFYDDLDQDGRSERIDINQSATNTWFSITDAGGFLVDQWNIRGRFDFAKRYSVYMSGDYNDSGTKELFFFTLAGDSILLHGLFDIHSDSLQIRDRYIARAGPGRQKPDPYVINGSMEDLNGDGKKELIFGISSGFSLYPRNVYAYYIDQDSLVSSPTSSYHIKEIVQADITGNGKREILLQGFASSNADAQNATYHDHTNWLMVLDQNLDFLFEPIDLGGKYEDCFVFCSMVDNQPVIFATVTNWKVSPVARHYRFDHTGISLRCVESKENITRIALAKNEKGADFFAASTSGFDLALYNGDMELEKVVPGQGFNDFKIADIDKNGDDEFIGVNSALGVIHVSRSGFRFPVSVSFEWDETLPGMIQLIKRGDERTQLYFQTGRYQYVFDYGPNPAYYLNFGVYFLIYAGMLAFTLFTRSVQRRQFERQQQTERRITELQISLLKNKLEPHFSINALNSVIQAIREERHEVAEEGLMRFVGMYRHMMVSSDSIDRALDEELAFTESYLELEKLRCEQLFSYQIEVSPGVDHGFRIPKMIIQLHAENAVKHGLAPLKTGGLLHIEIKKPGDQLQINITDNGIGYTKGVQASTNPRSQGLEMMKELYALYHKVSNTKIVSEIEELKDESGVVTGTRVSIRIDKSGDNRNHAIDR
jgi:hypothetical protein